MPNRVERAKELRKNLTDAEKLLWTLLRTVPGAKFRRQVPLGSYIVDFACLSHSLIIEVDGGQHANSLSDQARDRWLQDQGFRVIRFWNHEVLTNLTGVGQVVLEALAIKELD